MIKHNYLFYLLMIALFGCSQPSTSDEQEDTADSQPIISNGDVEISYESLGTGETTIVFVHGWCINKAYWDVQTQKLSQDYRIVSLDLGGHGASGSNRTSWEIEGFARDVRAVIDGLGLENVILIGHSMGGNIILEVANQIPDRIIGFIGIDNFKDVGAEINMEEVEGFMSMMENDFSNTVEGYSRAMLFHPLSDSAAVERVVADFRGANPTIAVASIRGLFEHAQQETELMKKLQIPINLIVGDATPMNEDSLRVYSPQGYKVRYMEGVGHYPMTEKPTLFTELLEETIGDILR